jgi:lipoprotein-anchoring transpeptidase ErfK/SrfK
MEVLMSRSRSRLSRHLFGILVFILALSLIFYIHDLAKSSASDKTNATAALPVTAKPPAVTSEISKPQPMVSSAPQSEVTVGPASTTKPPAVLAGTTPTTKPSTQPTLASKSQPISLSKTPLVDGKAKLDAGDLLGARRILNASLIAGNLSESDASQAKTMLNQISQSLIFSPKIFADDEFGGTYTVQPGELLTKIAMAHQVTWQYLCHVNNLSDPKKLRANATIKVIKGPFSALVEKGKFNMEIWIGGEPYSSGAMYVTSFPVGLGRDDSTPTGKWMIQPGNKIKDPTYYSPRGEGVIEANDPKNPLGKFWLGLVGVDGHAVGKMSYGIHGTIDPDSIGKQESMGCIRMRNEDVAQVFELLVEGKSIVIVKD